MISIAPGERVPRHRLIRNLIDKGDFEKAEGEIRIFEKDFGRDAPVTRYKLRILVGRAVETPGILTEDRVAILMQARDAALVAIGRMPENRLILSVYAEIGIALCRLNGNYEVYDDAMLRLKSAEGTVGDPEISKLIRRFERLMAGYGDATDDGFEVDSHCVES